MNNFSGEGNHLKLMAHTLQNMFPTINLATVNITLLTKKNTFFGEFSLFPFFVFIQQVNLSTVKRCVLFSYNSVTQLIDMRHFSVTVTPVGLNRSVKKVVIGKVPNLAKCEDIADFVTQ